MELENYFDFLSETDIRIKGTRVGLETIVLDYLELGLSAEEIAVRYPTLELEQVYATITYYWHNRAEIQDYIERVNHELTNQRAKQENNPSAAILRLRKLAQKRGIAAQQPVATP